MPTEDEIDPEPIEEPEGSKPRNAGRRLDRALMISLLIIESTSMVLDLSHLIGVR